MTSKFSDITTGSLSKRRWLLSLLVFFLMQITIMTGVFDRLEMSLYDSWFRLNGTTNPGQQVVIVAIDDKSINSIQQKTGEQFPWPRSVYGGLLEQLKDAQAVGIDLVFDAPTQPEEDMALAEAITKHGRVVLAGMFDFEENEQGAMEQVWYFPAPELGMAGVGMVNTPEDSDAVVRQFTVADISDQEPLFSLGVITAMLATGFDPAKARLSSGSLEIGSKKIPINDLNQAMPNFYGPAGTFKTYSFVDVLEGNIPPSAFKDKIVLIGPTAPSLHDVMSTPFTTSNMVLSGNPKSPGVEIHATIIQSILDHQWFRKVSPAINIAFLLAAGLLTTLIVSGKGPLRGLVGALILIGTFVIVAYVIWKYAHLWLYAGTPVALIFVTYAVTTAADFVVAELGRRRTRAMFSRYVSAAVAEELMSDPDSVGLGGSRKVVTIMFCDIRGFTAYSENKDPEEVVSRLNEYLTAMTNIIFRNGGTLDKYLGDGLMAIFGAPVYYPDHIQRAVQTAVEIQHEINELNRKWATINQPPLNIGVGINTGTALVGNVGSPERMDYTVIGEDVNLASRVEGLTKNFGTLIVISERSIKHLGEKPNLPWNFKFLGHAEVKGFTDPIGVFTVPYGEATQKGL